MGFDMSIDVKRTEATNKLKQLQKFEETWDKNHIYDFSVCYWRKCWNVFYEIEDKLDILLENDSVTVLSESDIIAILKLLKSYNKKTWNYSNSIWTWEEHRYINKRHIRNLKKILRLKRKHPFIEVALIISW